MTQDQVVDALAKAEVTLTKGGLSKYERGGSVPKPTVMRALACVFGVDSSYFLEEPGMQVRWLAFRKGSRLGRKNQDRVKALAEAQVEAWLSLKHALEPMAPDNVLPTRARVRKPEDAERAAESLREHWRLGTHVIESVTTAIEDGGGIVLESGGDEDLFDGLSGWVNDSIPLIVVSWAVSDDRRRFSLAHELGHLIMDVADLDERTEEKLAHRFAAAFLVTASTARRELGDRRRHLDFRELAMLKQKHGLSMQAWIMRAIDLEIISRPHAATLFAEMGRRGWRRKEPVEFEADERPGKLRQLTVRALAERLLTDAQAERICPGVTRDVTREQPARALDAKSLHRLPKDQRDRLMEQAAAFVAGEYEDDGGLSGFESLSEEDHRDQSTER
jgi:Zn-dependent peptidase ImmA (M78 family)